jgi:hypothetical protein
MRLAGTRLSLLSPGGGQGMDTLVFRRPESPAKKWSNVGVPMTPAPPCFALAPSGQQMTLNPRP